MSGATLSGGILGPVALMAGLNEINAAASSLLLNLEGVFTSLIAWTVFKENYDKRIVVGMLFILLGSILLNWGGAPQWHSMKGSLLIVLACFCWAVDNNFTRMVSANNPLQIATIKSLIAGVANIVFSIAIGAKFSGLASLFATSIVGFLGYGMSLFCFILALRHIGAARTGAYFSSAPFVGSVLAIIISPADFSWKLLLVAILMGIGIWIHVSEYHEHEHEHEEMEHSHAHVHRGHHRHEHDDSTDAQESHVHLHNHEKIKHVHPHYPDIHHHHSHGRTN